MVDIPHVRTHLDESGNVLVTIADCEVYDFVDDHLTEKHDLEQLWVRHLEGPPPTYVIAYASEHAARVEQALAELDAAELRRIFALNNSGQRTALRAAADRQQRWADRSGMSVQLSPVDLRWIKGSEDDPADICAHGDFEFRIDGDVLSDGSADRELTLSAAALYLLRTLSRSHTKDEPVGEHLFPCCGFAMYDVPEQDEVVIVGCPNGEDFEIAHREGGASVLVRAAGGREWSVDRDSWRDAVFSFADAVSEFYARSSPKRPTADDAAGFRAFQAEWERRRGRPFGRISSKKGPSPDGPTTRSR